MAPQTIVIFIIAFLAGVAGSEISHRLKHIERTIYLKLAVHLCSGFSGALLVLIILSRVSEYQLAIAIFVGALYGFIMANAKAYNTLR